MIWFDHVTAFTEDRHRTASQLRDAGFNAVEGGAHTGFGSSNDLCYFDLFYLELLEVTDAVEAVSSGSEVCRYAVEFLRDGDGLATLALETDDLEEVSRGLSASGFTVPDPVLMERVQDDGFVSRSRIIYPQNPDSQIRPPIVIERSSAPEHRRQELASRGTIGTHSNGIRHVTGVAVAVEDALSAAQDVASGYGVQADHALTPYPSWGGRGTDVHFGRARMRFVEPNGIGATNDRLESRGAGPFLILVDGGVNVTVAGIPFFPKEER